MKKPWIAALAAVVLAGLAGAVPTASSSTDLAQSQRYLVVLAGAQGDQGFTATGTAAAVNAAVAAAGGTVANDLSKQIGVLVAESSSATFASALSSSALVADGRQGQEVQGPARRRPGADGRPARAAAVGHGSRSARRRRTTSRPASRSVDVGILDSGIDGQHPDFVVDGKGSNVDCARGRNSVSFLPSGPGVGSPEPVRRQPVPRHARRRHRRRAGERDRRRRRRPERDARAGEGLRRERLLLRQRRRRRAHLRGRHQARRDQHELLRRRQRVPGVDRVQVQLRPDAAGVPPVGRAGDQVRPRPRRRAGGGARQLGRGSRRPVRRRPGRLRRRPGRDDRRDRGLLARRRRARRRATRTTASRRTTSPRRAATATPATARRRSSRRSRPARTAASRGRRWPRRTRRAWLR